QPRPTSPRRTPRSRPPEPVAPGVPTAGRSRAAGPVRGGSGRSPGRGEVPADVAVGRGPCAATVGCDGARVGRGAARTRRIVRIILLRRRWEEDTSGLQSRENLVCRRLLGKN